MYLIPPRELYFKLRRISSGYFFTPVDDGKKVILAAKLPTEIIMHTYQGAPIYFSFGAVPILGDQLDSRNLVPFSTFSVADDPQAMFCIWRAHDREQVGNVIRFLQQDELELYTFDELNRNVASYRGQVSTSATIVSELGSLAKYLVDPRPEQEYAVLSFLEEQISDTASAIVSHLRDGEFSIQDRSKLEITEIETPADAPRDDVDRFTESMNIARDDIGRQFEVRLTRLLARIFDPGEIIVSGRTKLSDSGDREYIDVVIGSPYGTCLIEAKARVVKAPASQTTGRIVSNIQKDISKALRQLRGALRKLSSGGHVQLQTATSVRELTRSAGPLHLIIALSEIHPDIALTEAPRDVIELGLETSAGVHVMDLGRLQKVIMHCSEPQDFFHYLDSRWEVSVREGTIFFVEENR